MGQLIIQIERKQVGITNPFAEKLTKELAGPIADYLRHLRYKGGGKRHLTDIKNKLNRITISCGFARIADLAGNRFAEWLGQQEISARTKNTYLQTLNAFAKWLVKNDWIEDNPFRKLDRFKGPAVRRRRALPVRHLQRLLNAAQRRPLYRAYLINRGKRKGEFGANLSEQTEDRLQECGYERYLQYKTTLYTGLREDELRRLRQDMLFLHTDAPHIYLPEGFQKNGKEGLVPLRHDLAEELLTHLVEMGRGELVFSVPDPSRVINALRKDLAFAGIPYRDAKGRYADFHALRYTLDTMLHEAKVDPRIIQLIMRHSDKNLTAHYDDATLHDLHAAVESLPKLTGEGVEYKPYKIDAEIHKQSVVSFLPDL